MRPFLLLVSALVMAHAQLRPLAAWPMRGRTTLHRANGLVAAPDNFAVVVKHQTGGHVSSSPAIGADGTVFVGSADGYLYALSPADGSCKWQFLTGGKVRSSPAIGVDGTVYVGSDDQKLYAINPTTGKPNWSFLTGDVVHSSPAIGVDGTVYVGSDDQNLYAINPTTGKPNWSFLTGGKVRSSPAIGVDGTVYVGTRDGFRLDCCGLYRGALYGISADGILIWVYDTGNFGDGTSNYTGVVESSPAIGADGTVYFGVYESGPADAVYTQGGIHAISAGGSHKWFYQVDGSMGSSPAIGADGTVYIGSDDGYLYALSPADGSPKRQYQTGGAVRSSPAIGADGTVYIGSDDGNLYGVGLSADYMTSSLHLAQRALYRNESAIPLLQHLCDFDSIVNFVPQCNETLSCNVCNACCKASISPSQCPVCVKQACPARTDRFTRETVSLVNTSCQTLANFRNSPSYGLAWEGFITPLSFTYYEKRIAIDGTMMLLLSTYEKRLADFEGVGRSLEERIDDAHDAVKSLEADEKNWKDSLDLDTTSMAAFAEQIETTGQQMNSKFAVLQGDFKKLTISSTKRLQQLNLDLEKAEKDKERKGFWAKIRTKIKVLEGVLAVGACLLETVVNPALALVCAPEAIALAVDGAQSVVDCADTFLSKCAKCKDVEAEMQEAKHAKESIDALSNLTKAAQALNAQLSTGAPLPEELPILISDKISLDRLRDSADAFRQELVNEAGDEGAAYASDINDWTNMGLDRLSLFVSYYNLATLVQKDAGALKVLQTRTSIVMDRLNNEQHKDAAVVSAYSLMYERQQKQAMLVTKYLFNEGKQFQVFSPTSMLSIALPDNPQSTDILEVQQDLDVKYLAEIMQQTSGRTLGWIFIEVNETAEPYTLESMRTHGSSSVVLPIPLKNITDPATNASQLVADTNYYDMRIHDIRIYLLDKSGVPIGDGKNSVQVFLDKSSSSSFFDSNMKLHVFTHDPISYGAFIYDSSKTDCPISQDFCGNNCPDYINFSPFGKWTVTVYDGQGADFSKIASMRFEFQVDYKENRGFSRNIFGKDYTQGFFDGDRTCEPLLVDIACCGMHGRRLLFSTVPPRCNLSC